MHAISLICFLLGVRAELSDFSAPALKKAKMAELKLFLQNRGLDCEGCAEKSDFVSMVLQHKDDPLVSISATATPSFEPPTRDVPPSDFKPDFNWADLQAKMEKGKKRIERVKRKMQAKGYDTSKIDANSLGSLADSGSFSDEQLMNILMSISGSGGKEAPSADDAPTTASSPTEEGGIPPVEPAQTTGAAGSEDRKKTTPSPTSPPAKASKAPASKAGASKKTPKAKPTKLPTSTPKNPKSKSGSDPTKHAAPPKASKEGVAAENSTKDESSAEPREGEEAAPNKATPTPTPFPKYTPKWRPPPSRKPIVIQEEEPESIDLDSLEEDL